MTLPLGIPTKVLRTAVEKGMHNDCIAAGADKLCARCHLVMIVSMEQHYAHLSVEEALVAMADDILEDAHA